jgi:hypothetical protein
VGKSEGKRPLAKSKLRGEYNIKMYLQEIRFERGLEFTGSVWEQVTGSCEHGNETSVSIKRGECL